MKRKLRKNLKFLKKISTFVMALFLCLGIFSAGGGTTNVYAEDQTLSDYIDSNASVFKIGDTTLKVGENVDVPFATTFSLKLAWSFTDNQYPTSKDDIMTYTLPSGLSANEETGNLMNGSQTVGTYTIKNNTLTIQYNAGEYEGFLQQSGRQGTVEMSGTLDSSITNNGKGGNISFNFPGIGTYSGNIKENSTASGLNISKTAGSVNDTSMTADYVIKVTSVGANTNVIVADTMGENLSLSGNVSFYTDEACTTAYTGTVSTEVAENKHSFTSTISSMAIGDELYAKYTVSIDKKAYAFDKSDSKNTNKAEITSTENPGTYYKPNTGDISLNWTDMNWTSKDGSVDSTNKKQVNWTITVNPDNKAIDIGGTTVKDSMSYSDASTSTYVDNSLKVVDGNGQEVTLEGLTYDVLTGNGYTFPANSTGKYVITYSTTVNQASSLVATKVTNKVTVNPFGNTTDKTANKEVTVGEDHTWISKACSTEGNSSKEVTWTITVNVGEDTSALSVKDVIPSGMSYVDKSISVTSGFTGTPTVNESNGTLNIGFGTDTISANTTIVFTIKTEITDDTSKITSKDYTNTAKYYDGDTQKGDDATAKYTYKNTQYLSKEYRGYQNLYHLTVSKLPADANTVTITDTLPENLKYKTGSLIATQHDWEPNVTQYQLSGVTVNETADATTGIRTLTFTISGDALNYAKNTGNLHIFYDIDYVNLQTAIKAGEKEYVNTAKITVDDVTCPDVSTTQKFTVNNSDIVNKQKAYSENTAPNADYTVVVNSKGLDLNDNGDTVTLIDSLGEALDYFMGSMTFTVDGENERPATDSEVSYNASLRQLTITVPDNKKVTIKYKATVNLEVGADLTEVNSKNTISISGGNGNGILSANNLSGKVLKSKGTSTSEGVSINIYKYKKDSQTTALSGAVFTAYEVAYDNSYNETSATQVKTATSGSTGYANISGLTRNKLYKVVETTAPTGYKADATPKYFIFENIGAGDVTYPSTITFNGKTYEVALVSASKYSTSVNWSNEVGETTEEKGKIIITKTITGDVTKEEAEGALVFKVTDSSSNALTYKLSDFVYDALTKKWTKTIDCAVGTYTVEESVKDVKGHTLKSVTYTIDSGSSQTGSSASDVSVSKDGTTTVAFADTYETKHDVTVKKTDVGGKEIAGAQLTITDSNNKSVDSWTSEEGKEHVSKLEAGTYTLTETTAPNGYEKAESVTFTVDENGKVTVNGKEETAVTMVDNYSNQTVEISKTDVGGTEIDNAKLTVKDVDGNVVTTWTSSSTETKKITVKPGTYTLHEDAAPNGYKVSNDVTFTVDKDGVVKVDGKVVEKVTMVDEYEDHTVKVSKTDVGGKELEGAKLTIKQGDTVVDQWTSTTTVHEVSLQPGTYTLHEEAAPNGYKVTNDITFKVAVDGTVTVNDQKVDQVTMVDEDANYDVTISKTDVGGEEVEGAELTVKDSDGNKVESWTSTKETKKITVKPGTYTLHEDAAPNGYKVSNDVTFVVDNDGKVTVNGKTVTEVTMVDEYEEHTVTISKTNVGGKELEGAKLTVKGEDFTETWTSTKDSHVITVKPGTYTLHEEAAPKGYKVTNDITFVVGVDGSVTVDGKTVDKITMVDEAEKDVPNTGDETGFIAYSGVTIMGLLAMIGIVLTRKNFNN